MLSWSWRSIKPLLLHLVGVPYYFTYIDEARSNTNQVFFNNNNNMFLKEIHIPKLIGRRTTWITPLKFCHNCKRNQMKCLLQSSEIPNVWVPRCIKSGCEWLDLLALWLIASVSECSSLCRICNTSVDQKTILRCIHFLVFICTSSKNTSYLNVLLLH
jgi:hypothetical protein